MRYHGGKFRLAPWIISHFPPHLVFVECYGGAASVLLQKPRADMEVYNDLNDDVVNLFQVLRDKDKAQELARQLYLTPYARTECENSVVRDETMSDVEKARRLVVRSQMAYSTPQRRQDVNFRNGAKLLRFSKIGDWSVFPEIALQVAERFSNVVIEQRPATQVLKQYDTPETLHYVDPPYVKNTRGDAGDDYAFEMTDEQHRELADVLRELKGMVVLSGYDSELYKELFADWHKETKKTLADGARKRTEILWINEAARQRLNANRTQGALFRETA